MINESIALLGMPGEDRITGRKGVITSICFDLYGCVQVALTPKAKEDGTLIEGVWVDIHRVEIGNDDTRVMSAPDFEANGSLPKTYDRGPAEKPAPR